MANSLHHDEIIVLYNPTNGQSCNQHKCYENHLVAGELVWFKMEVIWVNYGPPGDPEPDFWYEMVIKVVGIQDGMESCHAGFLPRHVVAHVQEVNLFHGQFSQFFKL